MSKCCRHHIEKTCFVKKSHWKWSDDFSYLLLNNLYYNIKWICRIESNCSRIVFSFLWRLSVWRHGDLMHDQRLLQSLAESRLLQDLLWLGSYNNHNNHNDNNNSSTCQRGSSHHTTEWASTFSQIMQPAKFATNFDVWVVQKKSIDSCKTNTGHFVRSIDESCHHLEKLL